MIRVRTIVDAGRITLWGVVLAVAPTTGLAALTVVETRPAASALAAPPDTGITVRFDRPVFGASFTARTFWAFGRWSGPVGGRFAESFDGLEVTLVPDRPFSAGEMVTVFLSRDLMAGDGSMLRSAGYSFQFWIRSHGSGFDFTEIARRTTRSSPEVSTRAYGGFGSDLDGDGFLDVTIVNEDTNDLRTFLNRADGSGKLRRMLQPPAGVGAVPSPSEPSDFDRDGHVDVAVANTRDRTVSILLGNGDGTFDTASHRVVGAEPRGLAVLDADGDGDVDIAATSFGEGRVTVLLNDGAGTFDQAVTFGGGGGERALAAGDMNGDGILDLVVGDLTAEAIRVYAGGGEAEFTLVAERAAGGQVWMLVLGDVDGDGDEDVATVNSQTNNAAILLGDGSGGLTAPRTVDTDEFPLATDLADLDGDGDLDWVTSSFSGDWRLFENDGAGLFAPARSFAAPQAASCSLPMDLDNDGVLDLVLIDELADEIVLMQNREVILESDFESGDTTDWSRTRGPVAVVAPGLDGTGHALEVAVDGTSGSAFVQGRWPATTSLVLGFTLDARELDLGGGDLEILRLGAGRGEVVVRLVPHRNRFRARVEARQEGGVRVLSGLVIPRKAVRLRLQWLSAARPGLENGGVGLARGRNRQRAEAIDNYGRTIGRIRLGLPAGSRGAGGRLLIDEVVLTR